MESFKHESIADKKKRLALLKLQIQTEHTDPSWTDELKETITELETEISEFDSTITISSACKENAVEYSELDLGEPIAVPDSTTRVIPQTTPQKELEKMHEMLNQKKLRSNEN